MCREQALDHWLNQTLETETAEKAERVASAESIEKFKRLPLAGDASFRKYYRVLFENASYILMDAPPPEVPNIFVQIAILLQAQGVKVPTIKAFDAENGFLLLSDFGDRLYLNELNHQSAPILYQDAIQALLKIQSCKRETVPCFDKVFMKRQLHVFKEWYLEKHLGLQLDSNVVQLMETLSDKLFGIIAEQPTVFVHQDYHSRNLMIIDNEGPGILDFQDAVQGPITYDLASLFQDAYISWPRSLIEIWVGQYQEKALNLGILSKHIDTQTLLRWMDLTGLQRHLKNLGVFARLHYRDGKKQYLNDIPKLQGYIQETYERYGELQPYHALFEMIMPEKEPQKCAP